MELKESEFFDLIEGKRIAMVCDDEYCSNTLLHYFINRFSDTKQVYLIIYSDIKCRKLKITFDSLFKIKPEFREVVDRIKIIKIGKSENIDFGELVTFVDEEEDIQEIMVRLKNTINSIDNGSLLVFLGFDLLVYLHDSNKLFRLMKDLFTESKTFMEIHFETAFKSLDMASQLFDVIVKVERNREFDLFSSRRTYDVYVYYSIFPELPPMVLYKIDETDVHTVMYG